MPETSLDRPVPRMVMTDGASGYAINLPAEWQDPNMGWWRDRALANRIQTARKANGITLHDALWAHLNDAPEPSPTEDSYRFDPAAQAYIRTDARV